MRFTCNKHVVLYFPWYVSEKGFNQQSDLHCRSTMSFDRPHTISYKSYIVIMSLSCTVSEYCYFPKLREVTWPWTQPRRGRGGVYHACAILVNVNLHNKFEVSLPNFTRSKGRMGPWDIKVSHVTVTTPLSGVVWHLWASTCYDQPTKFEVSTSTCYEDRKGDSKSSKWGGLAVVKIIQGHWK